MPAGKKMTFAWAAVSDRRPLKVLAHETRRTVMAGLEERTSDENYATGGWDRAQADQPHESGTKLSGFNPCYRVKTYQLPMIRRSPNPQ